MPMYTWLRPRRGDSKQVLSERQRVAGKLRALREALEKHIQDQQTEDGTPAPTDSSKVLRLATWNIREFDSNSYGERLWESKSYIAEILSHFDLIAVQEVREDLKALEDVMRLLGPGWGHLATDVTAGSAGNRERMVFVYN
ncbi:MAG: endonuclease, partial [Acidobacteria bacterium]|nr:endonuclease [Acidobacteriota bacterium]